MIILVGIHYGNDTQYTLCRSCVPIYGISVVRSPSFYFLLILKETLTFLWLSTPVLQYVLSGHIARCDFLSDLL